MIRRHRNFAQRDSHKSFQQPSSSKFTKLRTDQTEEIQPWKGANQDYDHFYNTPESSSKAILELTSRSRQPQPQKPTKRVEKPESRKKVHKIAKKKQPSLSNHRRYRSENNLKCQKKQISLEPKKPRLTNLTTSPSLVNMPLHTISINCKEQAIKPVNFFKLTFSPKKYPKNIIRKEGEYLQQISSIDCRQRIKQESWRSGNRTLKCFNSKAQQVDHPKLALEKLRKTFLEIKISRLAPNVERRPKVQ